MPENLLLVLLLICLVLLEISSDSTRSLAPFTAAKSVNNGSLCAFLLNSVSLLAHVSLAQCIDYCQRVTKSLSCNGINYYENGTCLTYNKLPTIYNVQRGCKYYATGSSAKLCFVTDGIDVAAGRLAFQISSYYSDPGWVVRYGNTRASCTLNYGGGPWWAVELQQPRTIVAVTATNFGYRPDRLDYFFVKLSNTQPSTGQSVNESTVTVCGQYQGSVLGGATAQVTCQPVLAKFVYVIVQGFSDALCLIRVEVYAAIQ